MNITVSACMSTCVLACLCIYCAFMKPAERPFQLPTPKERFYFVQKYIESIIYSLTQMEIIALVIEGNWNCFHQDNLSVKGLQYTSIPAVNCE